MRKAVGKINGTPEQEQLIMFEYEYIKKGGWFELPYYEINYCKVINHLWITPSDLKSDLELSIAEDLDCDPKDVQITCTINLPACIEERKATKTLFI